MHRNRWIRILLLGGLLLAVSACAAQQGASAPTAAIRSEKPNVLNASIPTAYVVPQVERTIAPTPTATPTPTPTPSPTPSPVPTPTPEPPFTMVWASDTQAMIEYERMRDGYRTVCAWVADNAESERFEAFFHTGDMVGDGDIWGQWNLFKQGLALIEAKMPFYWAVGNHDDGYDGNSPWRKQPFATSLPPEQSYSGGGAHYAFLEVGSTRLLILSIGYKFEMRPGALEWLRNACLAHSDTPAILLTHGFLTAEGGLMTMAEELESKVVAVCPNIRLILCGHARGISRAALPYDDDGDGETDRTVNALMYDMQTDKQHYGYVCLLTYDPVQNTLSVNSYSPVHDDYIYNDDAPEQECFILENVF